MKKAAIVAMVVVGMMVGTASGVIQEIVNEQFDGWTVGGDWSASGAYVARDDTGGLGGSAGAVVSNATLTLSLTPATYSNVWIHMYTQPVKAGFEPSVSGVSGAWYVGTDDNLYALIDTGWTSCCPVSYSGWVSFSAQIDYNDGTYNLYWKDNDNPLAALTKANTAKMNLVPGNTEIENVSVQSGEKTLLDDFVVVTGVETVGDTQDQAAKIPGMTIRIPPGRNVMFNHFGSYFDENNNGIVDGTLGEALLDALAVGDTVQVWGGPVLRFQAFEVKDDGSGKYFDPLDTLTDFHVSPTDPLWITTLGGDAVVNEIVFGSSVGEYDPDGADNVVIDPATDLGGGEIEVAFTPLAWPFNFSRDTNFGFDGADYGDRIFVDVNNDGQYTWLNYWGPNNWRTPAGQRVAIGEGSGIWYARYLTSGFTWDVTALP